MNKSTVIRTFPNNPPLFSVEMTTGHELVDKSGVKFLDVTAGGTAYAVVGYCNKNVLDAMQYQMKRYTHLDYKTFEDPVRNELADIITSSNPKELNRVFFSGGSGGEACETALQISYQIHKESGLSSKTWYLSRNQSYHGCTSGALSLGQRPNLEFFRPLLSKNRARVEEYNYNKNALQGESEKEYSARLTDAFRKEVLLIGPENIGGFVAETIMGGLVGDVPSSIEYWMGIREICTEFNIHLIIDEVWCGTGVTGKINCVEWYNFTPDFLLLGKTLAAGYIPLSAVLTTKKLADVIAFGSGRFETSCTFQGHSLACAAGLAVQRIIHSPNFVDEVHRKGQYIRKVLYDELHSHEFFKEIRGLGVRNTLEYVCAEQNQFGQYVAQRLRINHNIIVSGKWHRFNLSHAMTFSYDEINRVIEALCIEFRAVASTWTPEFFSRLTPSDFF